MRVCAVEQRKTEFEKVVFENEQLKKEIEALQKENEQLKKQMLSAYRTNERQRVEPKHSLIQAKVKERIDLFKQLFNGRKDVYAYRWENENGKAGYSPAKDTQTETYYPLTDQVLYDHLTGKRTIGIYPLLKDNTCWFLALDFDKENWQKDVKLFVETCNKLKIPTSLERSRSGNGCHVWIFFEESISAALARKLGNFLLVNTLSDHKLKQLSSFDRMFPNQDELTKGMFGNLIALPLQREARKNNNSVFIDKNFQPYKNQWAYLSTVKKLRKADILSIVGSSANGDLYVREVAEKQLPDHVNIVYANGIFIRKNKIPSNLWSEIAELAKFSNPAYYRALKKRLSTRAIPRIIDCSDMNDDYFILPRGCLEDLKNLLKSKSITLTIEDKAYFSRKIDVNFQGNLTLHQEQALQEMLQYDTGILEAATGFGKTVVGAALIAARKVNTLIIVHRKQLMDQWQEQLSTFLDIEAESIGRIGGGSNRHYGIVDIAMIQSLQKEEKLKSLNKYGQIIVDECHHISAFTFERVMKHFEAKYVHGLTATSKRKDGLEPIMRMQLGPVRYKVKAKDMAKVRPFKHLLIPRYTEFQYRGKKQEPHIQELYKQLIYDEKRNEMIFNDVLEELESGSAPIIITERIEHVELLAKKFYGFTKHLFVLTGQLNETEKESRLKALHDLPDDEERLVIATGKYIGEGFDHPRLDTLFLTFPISWKGTLKQYVGRLHRIHEKKSIVKVYDYVDRKEAVFENMFKNREKGYKAMGYVTQEKGNKSITEQMRLF